MHLVCTISDPFWSVFSFGPEKNISDPFWSEPTLNKFPSGPLQTAHWQSIGCGRSLLSSGELEPSFFQLQSSDLSCLELMTTLRGSCLLSLCPIEFLPFSLLSSLSWKTSSQWWMVLFCWNSVFRFRRKLCCEHTGSLLDPMHVNTYHAMVLMVVPWSRTHGLACLQGHWEGTVTLLDFNPVIWTEHIACPGPLDSSYEREDSLVERLG